MPLILALIEVLQCSASGLLVIHVDKDGVDTAVCIQEEKSCLTVNYALSSLQIQPEVRDSVPSDVEVWVSSSQKFNYEGIYDFNFTSLAIIGEGDVVFSGLFGMSV